mmetsp:Transcript_91403/g.258833  ORF Transcript_91403/g.258833 Transcript_91403/m.258833 type:complete len:205 (+) Transcript_91403:132-746(+)
MPSRNFRISLSLTRQDCRMRAAERDVRSMSKPETTSSSLVCALFSTLTPGSMFTVRTIFSPRKFRISMTEPPFVMLMLMGKCAYTSLILYSNLFCTPSNRLLMWLHTLRSMDSCLDFAKYIRALTSVLLFATQSSMGRCRKSRLRTPCLPVTSTFLALMVILMPLGTLMDSSCTKVFILAGGAGLAAGLGGCAGGGGPWRPAEP